MFSGELDLWCEKCNGTAVKIGSVLQYFLDKLQGLGVPKQCPILLSEKEKKQHLWAFFGGKEKIWGNQEEGKIQTKSSGSFSGHLFFTAKLGKMWKYWTTPGHQIGQMPPMSITMLVEKHWGQRSLENSQVIVHSGQELRGQGEISLKWVEAVGRRGRRRGKGGREGSSYKLVRGRPPGPELQGPSGGVGFW